MTFDLRQALGLIGLRVLVAWGWVVREVFDELDEDQSGFLDRQEVAKMCSKMGEALPEAVSQPVSQPERVQHSFEVSVQQRVSLGVTGFAGTSCGACRLRALLFCSSSQVLHAAMGEMDPGGSDEVSFEAFSEWWEAKNATERRRRQVRPILRQCIHFRVVIWIHRPREQPAWQAGSGIACGPECRALLCVLSVRSCKTRSTSTTSRRRAP